MDELSANCNVPAIIDIGCNFAHESFQYDRSELIARAKAAGIQFCIGTGSSLESNAWVAQFALTEPTFLRATAGIHPHHADSATPAVLTQVRSQLEHAMVCAVGETGLDYHRQLASPRAQRTVLEAHLQWACELKKPIFLHQRDAHKDFLPIVRAFRDDLPAAVVHCFTDNEKALFDYLDLDLHIGITGWIADERRGRHLIPLMPSIPANRLMIETDSPYLLPRTLRPKPKKHRNEPAFLPAVLEALANARSVSPHLLAQTTTQTAINFFSLPLDLGIAD